MTWTTPKTWVTNEPLTASDLNAQLRDNINTLYTPPADEYMLDEAFNYSTSSTNFVDIDGTNLALTITTTGRDVLIGFTGSFIASGGSGNLYLNVDIDGICVETLPTTEYRNIAFTWIKTGLSAGSHTFKLQWKAGANTMNLQAGAGTSGGDVHPQFFVREV